LGQQSRAADPPASTPGADLSIVSLAIASDQAVPGTPVSLDLVVRKAGACVDCGPVQISYWDDSQDGNVNCGDGATLSTVAEIPPQSDATVHVTLNGYPRPGKYRAWVWVDCQTLLAETDETNNKAYVDIEVTGASGDANQPGDSSASGDANQPGDSTTGNSDRSQDDASTPPASDASGFCGIWGQSAASIAAWMGLTTLGLMGLKSQAPIRSTSRRR
jgi:hypothetical protein